MEEEGFLRLVLFPPAAARTEGLAVLFERVFLTSAPRDEEINLNG